MEKNKMNLNKPFILIIFSLFLAFVPLGGCYYVGPPPPYAIEPGPPPSFDFAWDSALRAADESGIRITSANKENGTLLGRRGPIEVKITVMNQVDGRIRVELDLKSQSPQYQSVADDFYKAYDLYMGRK
jgi:hypothetical protein